MKTVNNDPRTYASLFILHSCRGIVGELLLSILSTLLHPLPAIMARRIVGQAGNDPSPLALGPCFATCEFS